MIDEGTIYFSTGLQSMNEKVFLPLAEIDTMDSALNWDICECPFCSGIGGAKGIRPDLEALGVMTYCTECDGVGIMGVRKEGVE